MVSGTALCLACGLCCTGVLHGRTIVAAEEEDRIVNLGFQVERMGDQLFFAQPCSKFAQNCCSVYALRPVSCQSYQCSLLMRLLAGDLSLEEGLKIVRQAQAMLSEVFAAMPEDWSIQRMRDLLKNDSLGQEDFLTSVDQPAEAAAILNFVMLSWHLNKYFR